MMASTPFVRAAYGGNTIVDSELAGDAAANLYAHDDAIAAYEQAVKFTDDLRDRARLLQKIGDHRVALGQFQGAESAHAAAAELYRELNDPEPEAIWRVRASLHRYTLDLPDPAADLEAMLRRIGPEEFMARSRLHLGIAWIVASFNNPTSAMEHLAAIDPRAIAAADDVARRFFNIRAWVNMLLGVRFRTPYSYCFAYRQRKRWCPMTASRIKFQMLRCQ